MTRDKFSKENVTMVTKNCYESNFMSSYFK